MWPARAATGYLSVSKKLPGLPRKQGPLQTASIFKRMHMNATPITHSAAHASGNLGSPGACLGRAQRMSARQVKERIRSESVNYALSIICDHLRPADVHRLICTASCAVRTADRPLADLLTEFADEIDPTPAYGDDSKLDSESLEQGETP